MLLAVEAEVAGHHVGHRTGQREKFNILPAEHLDSQADGGQRAVGAAAEQRHHAQRRAQARGQPQQRGDRAAKRSTGEKDGYDLAALEPGTQRDAGK